MLWAVETISQSQGHEAAIAFRNEIDPPKKMAPEDEDAEEMALFMQATKVLK